MTMKTVVKFVVFRVLCPVLLFFRVDKLLQIFSPNQSLIIFFHGVSKGNYLHINGAHMPVAEFERLLQYFLKNFDVVSLEALCKDGKTKTRLPRKTIALTFDDGFINNFEVAAPLLEKYKLPATFFISTASLKDPEYIHPSDAIDLLKYHSKDGPFEINGERFVKTGSALVREKDRMPTVDYLNSLSFPALRLVLSDIEKRYEIARLKQRMNPEFYQLISEDALRSFRNPFVTIGSHSHFHVSMNVLSIPEIKEQLTLTRASLEKCIAGPVDALAFPYGEFTDDAVLLAEKSGFEYLFAAGNVSPDSKVFPRIGVLSMRGFYYNVLSISSGFSRFGF